MNLPSPLKRPLRALAALLAALPLAGATCKPAPDPKAKEQAAIHYDLGVQAMQSKDSRAALREYEKAVELDPELDVAYNALGLLYHMSLGQPEKAIERYQRALQLNPKFSEAYTNLANVYLDQGRYDEAIPLYEKALSDILYKTPYIAENNLGWCYYKKGEVKLAIDHIRSALIPAPQFCLGHRNLGIIYAETGEPRKSMDAMARYVKACPEAADARLRYAEALIKNDQAEQAKAELATCAEKDEHGSTGDRCRDLLKLLGEAQ